LATHSNMGTDVLCLNFLASRLMRFDRRNSGTDDNGKEWERGVRGRVEDDRLR
jgi:hypothetical protein